MDQDLANEIHSRLKLDEKSDEPTAVTQVAYHHGSDNEETTEDHDEDQDANEDEVEELDTSEDDIVRTSRRKLETAQTEYDALPEGHEDKTQKLLWLADAVHQYHVAADTTSEEPFLEALRLATKARDRAGADDMDLCAAEYFQTTICVSLYRCTKDTSYLIMAVDYCRESITWWVDHGRGESGLGYDARCELLADIYMMLFKVEPLTQYINNAVVWQGRCVDGTNKEDYDENADAVLYKRYKTWVNVNVRLMDRRPDIVIDPLVDQINKYFPCNLQDRTNGAAHNYWKIRLGMYCRKWARDPTPDNFALVLRDTEELMAWENGDPVCTCHGNLDDPAYSADPENPQHVIRRAAGFFDEWFGLENEDSEWYDHVATISVSLALWDEAYKIIPRGTFSDVLKNRKAIRTLWFRSEQKYEASGDPLDGWRADSREWESAIWDTMNSMLENGSQSPNDSLKEIITMSKRVTVGYSHVTRQQYSVYGKLDYKEPWDLETQRLKFLSEGDGKWSVKTWIRERSADGKFILGGAIKGRDDDVLEFLEEMDEDAKSLLHGVRNT